MHFHTRILLQDETHLVLVRGRFSPIIELYHIVRLVIVKGNSFRRSIRKVSRNGDRLLRNNLLVGKHLTSDILLLEKWLSTRSFQQITHRILKRYDVPFRIEGNVGSHLL